MTLRRQATRTKIVATLGPASSKPGVIRKLVAAGVDVFRINFSHGSHESHALAIRRARRAARLEKAAVAILADLQGPKIRVGTFEKGEAFYLKRGERFVIVADPELVGRPGRVGCSYAGLPSDLRRGERILLDDGNIELRVEKVDGLEVVTRVRYGGLLREHKGINLPGTRVKAPCLGEKDLFDLDFALAHEVDYVALSFVRSASDISVLKKKIAKQGGDSEVIAKIERPEAVKNFDAILAATDGVMIARGDMGVELGAAKVPSIQKRIIRACKTTAKPVITATQMLESMVDSPRPTRAEASDVANAIYDGTSALMLSAETASGAHPVLAVKTMDRIARQTELEILAPGSADVFRERGPLLRSRRARPAKISEATVSAAARAALEVDAKAVMAFTETGRTAKLVARERLPCRVIALTHEARSHARLALHWGIIPVLAPKARSIAQMHSDGLRRVVELRHCRPGDRVVLIAGAVQVAGATNTVVIREIPS